MIEIPEEGINFQNVVTARIPEFPCAATLNLYAALSSEQQAKAKILAQNLRTTLGAGAYRDNFVLDNAGLMASKLKWQTTSATGSISNKDYAGVMKEGHAPFAWTKPDGIRIRPISHGIPRRRSGKVSAERA